MRPRALILTGARGAGKTTLCLHIAASSPKFAGIVCPAFLEDGQRQGYDARCLKTGQTWPFARTAAGLAGPRFGRFWFSADGITRAVSCLRDAREAPGGVTVIDEIGPLELDMGQGFAPVLPLLAAAGNVLLVVRPELVERVRGLVPRHEQRVVAVDATNAAEAAAWLSA